MFNIPGAHPIVLPSESTSKNPLGSKRSSNTCDYNSNNDRFYADSTDETLTLNIRNYFDEVFGPLIRSLDSVIHLDSIDYDDEIQVSSHVFSFIGSIVDSILRFNNVHFKISVHEVERSYNIPEPLWFHFDKTNLSRLYIFVSINWYIEYISIRSNVPIIWTTGHIPISMYNPIEEETQVILDSAKIKCVVACDHLAQHILHKYYSKEMPVSQADIHEGWTEPKVGVTFHSIIKLKSLYTNNDKKNFNNTNSVNTFSLNNVGHWF